ncbi:Putative adhesin [Arthrobacter sp. ov118]|nr:Putative adhesin [Arthrobacter sp. ov118]
MSENTSENLSENAWTVTGPQTIDVDGVRSLKLGIVRGRFDIVTHDESVARIEVSEIEGDPLAVSVANGRLEVRHQLHGPQGWFKNLMGSVNNNSSNSVVISIALPAGVEVEAGTVSGDGMVSGISGHARLNTVSGSVLADGTSGELAVNTVSGEVIARNHRGVLTAKSVSGEVTASGDFSHIRANTVSGDLNFDLYGFTRDFGANSVSGDVTIRLPHDVGVDIIAKSASGAVVINNQRYIQPGGTVQTIEGPDTKLMLVRTNSVSGKTSIFHAQPAPDTETAL